MTGTSADPAQHIWWLASRASGLVALALITASVMLGLAMANRLVRGRNVVSLHEQLSLAGLVAIAAHGLTLLGDPWLHPGLKGIAVPFAMSYRSVFTGLGVVGGYLAAALGLSFYIRRKMGARLWRKLHRFTPVAYGLALVHTIGAGTDAATPWLRTFMLVTAVPIVLLLLMRLRRRRSTRPVHAPANRGVLAPGEAP